MTAGDPFRKLADHANLHQLSRDELAAVFNELADALDALEQINGNPVEEVSREQGIVDGHGATIVRVVPLPRREIPKSALAAAAGLAQQLGDPE